MINEDEKAELTCHFCNKKYMFTKEELEKMIAPSSYTGICSVLARELADKAEAKAKMMTEK